MKRFTLAMFFIFLNSCSSTDVKPDRIYFPETQIEAGQVYVSMYPPILWYDIVDDLKPNFTVNSANDFLDDVLQITSKNQEINQNRKSFGLGIGLPTSSTTGTNTTNTNSAISEDGSTTITGTNTVESTTSQSDGNVPTINTNSAVSSFLTSQPSTPTSELGADPFLKYRAATALYQEVQLLNRYLDVEVATNGTIPYLFRTQIAVQPNARNISLDIYTELFVEIFEHQERENDEAPANERNIKQNENKEKIRPEIIPLIVIDNLERSASRRLESAVNQLSFALSGLVGKVGLASDLDNIKEELKDIEALDFNSITTVAKSSHDQLTVRIGAVNSSNGLNTLARSYDVTFLVLWPGKEVGNKGVLRQFSHMRRTDNGERLPLLNNKYQKHFAKKISAIARTRGISKENSHKFADCIVFDTSNEDAKCKTDERKNLYVFNLLKPYELEYDAEIFELVRSYLSAIFIKNDDFELSNTGFFAPLPQIAIMNDPGTGFANVIIGDANKFGNSENIVAAIMFVPEGQASKSKNNIIKELNEKFDSFYRPVKTKYKSRQKSLFGNSVLAASSVRINNDGLLTATFPSPTSIGQRKKILNNNSYLILDRRLLPHEESEESEESEGDQKKDIDINQTRGIYPIALNRNIGKVPVPVLHKAKLLPTTPKVLENGKSEFQITIAANPCPQNALCPTNISKYQVLISDYYIDTVTSDINPIIDRVNNSFEAELNKAYKITLSSLASSAEFSISVNAIDSNGEVISNQKLLPILIKTK